MSFKDKLKERTKKNNHVKELLELVISNVEKEADDGGYLHIEYLHEGDYNYTDISTVVEILQGEEYGLDVTLKEDGEQYTNNFKLIISWME